jgi:hypothetical protein
MAEKKRMLVLAPAAVDGASLREEIERRAGAQPVEVRLVAPAVTDSKLKHAFGDVDDAIEDAGKRLDRTIDGLRGDRLEASGAIGDADPLIAAEDALGAFPADEILIVTHAEDQAEWFEDDLFDRAAERFEPLIVHVELEAGANGGLSEVEESSPGLSPDEPAEEEVALSPNLPPFSKRDLLGVVVAIVGTIVLAVLAASGGNGDSGASAARILIAIAIALVNLAHVVGLVLFNSQQYRGPGRTLFGNLSLFGTPIAIVASLILLAAD